MELPSMRPLMLLVLASLVGSARPCTASCEAGEARLSMLFAGLHSESAADRRAAAVALAAMKQRAAPALPALLDHVWDPDNPTCHEVRLAIMAIVHADAGIFHLLEEEKNPGETGVIATLGHVLRNEGAFDWNRDPTDDEKGRVARGEATDYAMSRVLRNRRFPHDASHDQRAALVLARALGPRASSLVPDIVVLVSDGTVRKSHSDVMREGMRALSRMGPEGIAALRKLLADPDASVREEVTAAVAQSPRAASALVTQLVPMLKDQWAGEDAALALGLARPVTRETLDALVAALRSPEQDVRVAATEAIGWMGDAARPAVPALAAFLVDPELAEALDPRDALLHLGPAAGDALPELIQALREEDGSDEGTGTADVLRSIGAPSVPVLIAALESKDPGARARAADALGAMPEWAHAAIPALRRAEDDPDPGVRSSAADARATLEETIDVDRAALDRRTLSTQWMERVAAYETLSHLPKKELVDALPLLERCFRDADHASARDCANALGRMGSSGAPALKLMVERMRRPGEADVEMFEAIERLGPLAEIAVPVLCDVLDGDREANRADAARALGAIGPAALGAVPRLEEMLDEDDWDVQVAAAEALSRIRGVP